jgi:hypothetical protein
LHVIVKAGVASSERQMQHTQLCVMQFGHVLGGRQRWRQERAAAAVM